MITRFFSTSKPIHLVIILVLTVLLFFGVRFNNLMSNLSTIEIGKSTVVCLLLIFTIVILAFFVTKNNLTLANGYKILFYFLFLSALPSTVLFNDILISNFFVLLALRRIISLRSKLRVKKKLLDAAFWIGIASLFYFWSFLFFGLILAALFLYSIESLKNWVIPFLGLITVVIITVCASLIFNDSFGNPAEYIDGLGYDFTAYNDLKYIVPCTILLSLGLWSLFFYAQSLKDKPKVFRASHILVLLTAFIALVIIVVTPNKNGGEFIFLFTPLAIIMSNYIQGVSDRWFAEAFVWILVLTPLSLLIL